ncbi:MAG TPA: electron transport complex subunit E [Chitinispirillaceae bacterium]|jgi:electron transport complex protein RnfE|nr:electron transport complex subunit E [Chitinispirillaceae bacterium]
MLKGELKRGLLTENPIFVLVLGLCPSMATSTSIENGIGMGLAATFVLACSNVIISLVRKVIPDKVRIPCFIVIIATFVTVVQFLMKAYLPALDKQLGIFVPLIVVNCIILGRAEAFASKSNVFQSLIDGVVIGLGFTLALFILSFIRESIGSNKLLGLKFLPGYEPMTIFILAPGGFFTIALVMGLIRHFSNRKRSA